MSYIQVGSCPKCGAPIYAPQYWNSVVPPPNNYTCSCFPQILTYATNTIVVNDGRKKAKSQSPEEFKKTVDSLGDALKELQEIEEESNSVKKELSNVRVELTAVQVELQDIKKTLKLLAKLVTPQNDLDQQQEEDKLERTLLKG